VSDDEVEQIYNYLHENYEYRDGELLRIKAPRGRKIGQSVGTFIYLKRAEKAILQITILLNGKRRAFNLSRMIFLYHFKELPSCVKHYDGNIMNFKIENLYASDHIGSIDHTKFKGFTFVNNAWKVRSKVDGKVCSFGSYNTEEVAKEVYECVKKNWIENRLSAEEITQFIKDKYKNKTARYCRTKGYKMKDGKYIVRITHNKKRIHIGTFYSEEEAHAAYLKAKEEYAKNA
jgi:hypothetical protein